MNRYFPVFKVTYFKLFIHFAFYFFLWVSFGFCLNHLTMKIYRSLRSRITQDTYLRFFHLPVLYWKRGKSENENGDSTAINIQIGEKNKKHTNTHTYPLASKLKKGVHLHFKTLTLELSRKRYLLYGLSLFYSDYKQM